MPRRTFLRNGSVGAAALVMGGGGLMLTACDPVPLGPPDGNGVKLPPLFSSRVVATSGQPVGSTGYDWHNSPDGGACFGLPDGGWSYVSNSEALVGGASYVRFDADANIVDAGMTLEGTTDNCSGGATPWGTWLSCEEISNTGRVFECDPVGATAAVERPLLGRFSHEAAAADETNQVIYLTEDQFNGAIYRFVPTSWGDLSAGVLEVLTDPGGTLTWTEVPDPSGGIGPTKYQVPDTMHFAGGEGCAMSGDTMLFTTKLDGKVWAYDTMANSLSVMFDPIVHGGVLTGVDALATSSEGVAYVAEDDGDMQIVLVRPDGSTFPVLQVTDAPASEITGPAFDPKGVRLYFSSQRDPGRTYEIKGPWSAYTDPGPFVWPPP